MNAKRTLLIAALAVAVSGCWQESSKAEKALKAGQEKVAAGDYAGAISILTDAASTYPDDPYLRRAVSQAFAARAGATTDAVRANLLRRDGAGVLEVPSATSMLSDLRGLHPWRGREDNAYRMKDLRRALTTRVADAAAAAALPKDEQAEVGTIAGALAVRCVWQVLDGAAPDKLTDDQIAAAVAVGFDGVADTLPGAYQIFKATRAAVLDAVAPVASAMPYDEGEVPAALDTPAQLTAGLQRAAGQAAAERAAWAAQAPP